MAEPLTYRRLRAPRQEGELLIEPGWNDLYDLADRNAATLENQDFEVAGRSFQQLRHDARLTLVRTALHYSSEYCDVPNVDAERPLILTGHQPELFHPGVWAKNFAADVLAQHAGGAAVHVIVDHDLCRQRAIRVPTGTVEQPRVTSVPFDRHQTPLPYEARQILDTDLLSSFADRVQQLLQDLIQRPLLQQMWPEVLSAAATGKQLGYAIAQGRHQVERRWGGRTLEVPASQLCDTEAFRRLCLHLLLGADRTRRTHNRLLTVYRQVHRLRSSAQPLPDLRVVDGWIETPFWIWTAAEPSRKALWSRQRGSDLQLSDRDGQVWSLPRGGADTDAAVQRLVELGGQGLRIRPRALTNTMYLRLMAGDLFVHGIGGAKYDQITDRWIEELFGVSAPSFVTLSYTTHLPIEHVRITQDEVRQTRQQLRQMRFHPERYLSDDQRQHSQVSRWLERKHELISWQPPAELRHERHHGIAEVNAQLATVLCKKTEKLEKLLVQRLASRRSCELLESREYAFCLYPEESLRLPLLELDRSLG